jgi:Do/DeqQ family serine protease
MKFSRIFSFLFTSITTGLAAAFIVMLVKPELISQLHTTPPREAANISNLQVHSFADVVQRAEAGVVSIYTTKFTRERSRPLLSDPVLQQFFGDIYSKPKINKKHSLGAGVVVDQNGFILTNAHVVEGADDIWIGLDDRPTAPARIVGIDKDTDLAVIQAGGKNLPAAKLGESESLRVGDVVLAIGNPFGVGKTVTQGIISATGRYRLGLANFENFIQTDAAINQGNSGGALINTRGEVIGISTAIISGSGGSHGIGFAIPISLARQVMEQIIAHGRVIRGWIGVSGQELTPQLAESLELEDRRGVLVSGVLEGGPADVAGLQLGDVIQAVNGTQMGSSFEMLNLMATTPPGSKINLTVSRADQDLDLEVQVAERPLEVE